MMGRRQQRWDKLFYTLFSLDQRIRPDNPLRRIREIVDFSLVRPARQSIDRSHRSAQAHAHPLP